MKLFARTTKVSMGVALGILALGAGFEACSSSSGGPGAGFGNNDGSTGGGDGGVQTMCASPTLNIIFAPMYSAYIPGSTMHQFQIPAILDDGSMATWSVSDPSKATLSVQTFDGDPGVMVTVTGTGMVQVIATKSGGACGTSTLNITSATENDWQTGNARYNDGVSLHLGPGDGGFMRPEGGFGDGGFMRPEGGGGFPGNDSGCGFVELEGGTACTNCHGATGATLFNDVAHTPEQTGGFSDEDLINIIVNGEIPDGGYFDPSVIISGCEGGTCADRAYQRWHAIHQWCDIQPDQYTGIVTYLRSLTPAPQTGTSNFGGHHRDGGRPPMPDSGGPGPSNDAASSDATSD
ncbi:MAG TPA: hypothetical protein VF765_13855 [Polyangiaceae bacterium]